MPAESYLQRQQRLSQSRGSTERDYSNDPWEDPELDDTDLRNHGFTFAMGDEPDAPDAPQKQATAVDNRAPLSTSPNYTPSNLQTAASAPPQRLAATASLPPLAPISGGPGRVFVPPSSVYQRGVLAPSQVATPISQFDGPDNQRVDEGTEAHILALLNNPYSLSDSVVNQQKSRGRDAAVGIAEQLRGANASDMAGRGFSASGGIKLGTDAMIDSGMLDSIVNSNREIDLTKAATDRSDLLNVLGASDAFQSGRVGRAATSYGAKLSGEQAREGQRTSDNTNLLQRFVAEEGSKQAEDNSNFRNDEFKYGQMKDDRAQTLAEWLAQETAQMNRLRTDIGASQFDMNFGENSRQFNNNTAFNYASLNATQQAELMNQVCKVIKC